jgi:hypothetical protein
LKYASDTKKDYRNYCNTGRRCNRHSEFASHVERVKGLTIGLQIDPEQKKAEMVVLPTTYSLFNIAVLFAYFQRIPDDRSFEAEHR